MPFDVIFVEGLLFDSMNKKPVIVSAKDSTNALYNLTLDLFNPAGVKVFTTTSVAKNGAVTFSYKIPLEANSGDYLIKVYNKDIPVALRYISIKNKPDMPPFAIGAILNKMSYSFGD
jgi:hypothetical protein